MYDEETITFQGGKAGDYEYQVIYQIDEDELADSTPANLNQYLGTATLMISVQKGKGIEDRQMKMVTFVWIMAAVVIVAVAIALKCYKKREDGRTQLQEQMESNVATK